MNKRREKRLSVLIIALMVIFTANLFADETGTPGLLFTRVPNSINPSSPLEEYRVTRGTATEVNIIVPATNPGSGTGFPVTEIGIAQFNEWADLESITLPNTLRIIRPQTFENSVALTSVVLPSSVTRIMDNAFNGATALAEINFHAGLNMIGANAFRNTALVDVVLPNSVSILGVGAFSNIATLESVTLPAGEPVTGMLTRLEDDVFRGATALTEIILPRNILRLGENVFAESGLEKITINANITHIPTEEGQDPWHGNAPIANVNFGAGVTGVLGRFFAGLEALKEFTVPATFNTLPNDVFNGSGLETLTVQSDFNDFEAASVITLFRGATEFKHLIFTGEMTRIANYFPGRVSSLRHVTIDAPITHIGEYAFAGAWHIGRFTMPDSLVAGAIQLPNTITHIGRDAFSDIMGRWFDDEYEPEEPIAVWIPKSVTHVGSGAFVEAFSGGILVEWEEDELPATWANDWNRGGLGYPRTDITFGVTIGETSEFDVVTLPSATGLVGNFPNPFNPTTSIRYQVSGITHVSIEIFNIRGQRVKTLLNGSELSSGEHSVVWDGRDDSGNEAGSGMYLYRMVAGEYQSTRRMILMK
jgi:hypothetical protein